MGGHNIHILLVEDDPDQIQLIQAAFDQQTEQIDLTVATHLADARARLGQFKPDLVIIDLLLPDGNGLELVPKSKEKLPYPFVILTAHGNEHMAVESLKRGALDYVVKDERTFKDLPHVVRRTLREWDHIIERKQAEKALEKALEKANQVLEERVKVRTVELLETNLRLQRQITERKQAERTLKQHFRMESIVTAIATRFINLPRQKIDGAIQQALEDIGRLTGVDRSYLILLSEDGTSLNNTHEWCAEGIPAQIQDRQDLPVESLEWALNPLRRGEVLHIPSVDEIPSAAGGFQKMLQAGGICSILNISLLWTGKLRGVIGFDTVNESKKWNEQDLTLLQTVATIFSNALQRQQTEKRLRQSEARLAEAQHIAHLGSWELNLISNTLTWSEEVFRILEVDKTQFDSSYKSFLEHIHPDDRTWVYKAYRDSVKNKTPYDTVHRLRLKDGPIKYVHERCETFYDGDGKPLRSVGTVQDITDRRQDQEQLRLAASVFESTMEGVTITDADARIIAVNRAFTEITGYAEEEVLGKNPRILKSDRHDGAFYRGMWKSILQTGRWRGEIWERNKTGEVFPAWLTINAVRNSDKLLTHYVATFSDISALKHSQAKLNHLAHHDALTDLPNRLLLSARLEHCVERARRDQDQVAILFLDLDDFKQINDSLGHPVGDKVLIQVAARLFSRVREDDTVARLGGDEFVIVMGQIDIARKAALLAEGLLAEIARPVYVDRQELFVTGSIGISIFPQDGADIATLLRNADTAMYRAKEEARNSYQFYTTRFTTDAFERMRLQTDLRRALENQEFEVYYQMQTEVTSGRIVGAEALIRWQHPEMGLVTPASFINLAEQTGQITALGEWVLRRACEQWVVWEKQGLLLEHIAVNLSGRQIHQAGLVDQVERILADTGCPPQHLELEVSEGYIMCEVASAQKVLNGLRALGVSLAIDDFGTGYSSLAYLKRLPIGKLKIDRAFVRDVPADPEDAAITRAVIALGKSLRLEVIAEGVENEAQLNFLNHEGCDQIQGYLHGNPAPPEQFEQQLIRMGIERRPRTSDLLI